MRFCVLGSGSSGNAVVVESDGECLLVDAGFSCRELERRMKEVGMDPGAVVALVLTHEHGDHVRGAPRFSRRFGVPVYATAGTLEGLRLPEFTPGPFVVGAGRPFEVGRFHIEPFSVPHDAREPVGVVLSNGEGARIGLAADLGRRCSEAWARLRDLDALILESNHDLEMLMKGPYPWPLKHRIAGEMGHLSNQDAADGLAELVGDRLEWIVLYHLSQVNNVPAIAEAEVGEALDRYGAASRLRVTSQAMPSPWMEVGKGPRR
jgi:phosphoribosyl 1,2-cyclic phosphodiesterase